MLLQLQMYSPDILETWNSPLVFCSGVQTSYDFSQQVTIVLQKPYVWHMMLLYAEYEMVIKTLFSSCLFENVTEMSF